MEDGDDLEDLEDFYLDLPFLETFCQDGDCPPPLFLLPPPPRPPELGESCSTLSPYESCDNIIIIDSQVGAFFYIFIRYFYRNAIEMSSKLDKRYHFN